MPVVVIEQANEERYGCSCPAWRRGEPEPGEALRALARAVVVTVERQSDSMWLVWTDPESRYHVVTGTNGGWCKHVAAVMFEQMPWLRQAALGADDLLARVAALEKEVRRLDKEVGKRDREIGRL